MAWELRWVAGKLAGKARKKQQHGYKEFLWTL